MESKLESLGKEEGEELAVGMFPSCPTCTALRSAGNLRAYAAHLKNDHAFARRT